jgi:hypothetical protein
VGQRASGPRDFWEHGSRLEIAPPPCGYRMFIPGSWRGSGLGRAWSARSEWRSEADSRMQVRTTTVLGCMERLFLNH